MIQFLRLFFMAFPFIVNIQAQSLQDTVTFEIIRIQGEAKIKTRLISKNTEWIKLKARSIFSDHDTLIFSSPKDWIVLIDNSNKVYIARPDESPLGYTKQPNKMRISNRNVFIECLRMENPILEENFLILGEKTEFQLCNNKLLVDDKHFFILTIENEGRVVELNHINKKILFEKTKLVGKNGINKSINILEDCELLYYIEEEKIQSKHIDQFNIVFPNDSLIIDEVNVIIDHITHNPESDIEEIILNYLTGIYGVPERANYINWLKRHFSDKLEMKN